MTQKAEKLIKKFNEKMDIEVFLYRENFNTFEKAIESIKNVTRKFSDMITEMYYYNLLNEVDFLELNKLHNRQYELYFTRLLDIKFDNEEPPRRVFEN